MPGSPIRTPWDHSSVDSSPRPIAASHVLHRLLVPRHPPSALDNLTTKMLASTVYFSTNNPPATTTPHQQHHPTPTTRAQQQHPVYEASHARQPPPHRTTRHRRAHGPRNNQTVIPSGPNRVSTTSTSRIINPFPHPPPHDEKRVQEHPTAADAN